MAEEHFHHALKVLPNQCIACTHCMIECPTAAIRVQGGIASITANRCVDCGNCLKACPVEAIIIEDDDFNQIHQYKHPVALVPSVLIGQFPEEISEEQIYSELHQIGFSHVYEVENSVDIIEHVTNYALSKKSVSKPLISSFCPAVVRLVQAKFPALVDHILPIKPPVDIAALFYKKKLLEHGEEEKDIGMFYITPCAAKIAAIKSPVGEEESIINGVINSDSIYNKIYQGIKQEKKEKCIIPQTRNLTPKEIQWSITGGEAEHINGRTLAVDGIHNITKILEKIEDEELTKIDYLEMRACDESCAGGVLLPNNRFLTVDRLKNRSKACTGKTEEEISDKPINQRKEFLKNQCWLDPIKPRPMEKLDEDIQVAMDKMQKMQELQTLLPDIDCGSCGAPSCKDLAEDVVRGKATVSQCVFIQRVLVKNNKMTIDEALDLVRKIWGKNKLKDDYNLNY